MRKFERYHIVFSGLLCCSSIIRSTPKYQAMFNQASLLFFICAWICVFCSIKCETIRVVQIPNVLGLIVYGLFSMIAYFTSSQRVQIMAGWILVVFFGWTCYLANKYGNISLEACATTGPFGVACQRFWTKKNKNHVMVYYPIQKRKWKLALNNPNLHF
jgi:hypothetical protein